MEDFLETRFEALGAGHFDPNAREEDATEARGTDVARSAETAVESG